MHTKAVFRAAQALSEVGIAALRFNFRGVGLSTGTYDDGIGEQDDVRVALAWMRERYPGLPMIAGGFSFGSMVSLSVGGEAPGAAAMLSSGTAGPTVLLVQSMDARPALSFSLFAFRRSPWPADFAPVEVRSGRLSASPGPSS